jgi:outer membrane protease
VITIKKISSLVILTAFLLSPAFAEAVNGDSSLSMPTNSGDVSGSGRYGFSLSPYIGILYGHSEEIVYKDPPEQNLYLSELLWDLKPLLYAGLGVDFAPGDSSRKQGFAAALSFKAGLPLKTGIIENRDWINENFITHYSRHDAYSRTTVLLDVSAGYFRRFFDSLALNIYGEISYAHLSWSGANGYTQYPITFPWDSSFPKTYYSGEVIRYSQNWFIAAPGVSLDWDMNRLFSLKAFFNYSPLIYCADRDDHLVGMKRTFLDYLYFGQYIKAGGGLTLSPSQNTGISLHASYKRITGARGNTFEGGWLLAQDGAGAALKALDLGFAVNFRLKGRG